MKRLKELYSLGYQRELEDVKVKRVSKMPYLTDPSFFVPSSETAKTQSTYDMFNGAYDDYKVPDELVDLRRPGNDVTESSELVGIIREDFEKSMSTTKDELSQKALNDAKAVQQSSSRDEFIDNLMSKPTE